MSGSLATGSLPELIGLWVAALLTLAVMSFVIKDNPVFRITQDLFVGISAGYAAALAWNIIVDKQAEITEMQEILAGL